MPRNKEKKKVHFYVYSQGKYDNADTFKFVIVNSRASHAVTMRTEQIDGFREEIAQYWAEKNNKKKALPEWKPTSSDLDKQRQLLNWVKKLAKSKKLCALDSPLVRALRIPVEMRLGTVEAGEFKKKFTDTPTSVFDMSTSPRSGASGGSGRDSLEDVFDDPENAPAPTPIPATETKEREPEDSAGPPLDLTPMTTPEPTPTATEEKQPEDMEAPPPRTRRGTRVSGPAPDPSSFGLDAKEPSAEPPSPERSPGPNMMYAQSGDANRQLMIAKDDEITQLRFQLTRAKEQISEHENKLQEREFEREQWERRHNQAQERLEVYEQRFGSDIEAVRSEANYKNMVDDATDVSIAVLYENQNLAAKVKILKDELRGKDHAIAGLKAKVSHLSGAGRLENLEQKIDDLNDAMLEIKQLNSQLKDRILTKDGEINGLNEKMRSQEANSVPISQLRAKEAELQSSEQEANRLREQVQQKDRAKQEIERKADEAADEASKRYSDLRREKDEKIGTLQTDLNTAQKDVTRLTKENERLERELNPPEVPQDQQDKILGADRPDRVQLCRLKKEVLANRIIEDKQFITDLEEFEQNGLDASDAYIQKIQMLEDEIKNLEDALRHRAETEAERPTALDIDSRFVRDFSTEEFAEMYAKICPGETPLITEMGSLMMFAAPKEELLLDAVRQRQQAKELEDLVDQLFDTIADLQDQNEGVLEENIVLAEKYELAQSQYLDAVNGGGKISDAHRENARRINENRRNANRARRRLDPGRVTEVRTAQSLLRTHDGRRVGSSTGRRTPSMSRQGSSVHDIHRVRSELTAPLTAGSVYYNDDGTIEEDSILARAMDLVEVIMSPEDERAENRIFEKYLKRDKELTDQLLQRTKEDLVNECIARYIMCEQVKQDAKENAALLFAQMEISDHKKDLMIRVLQEEKEALERRIEIDEDLKRMLRDGTPAAISAHIEKLRRVNDYLEVQMRRMRDAFNKNDQELFDQNAELKRLLRNLGREANGEKFEPVKVKIVPEHRSSTSPTSSTEDAKVEDDGSVAPEVPNGLLTFEERKEMQAKLFAKRKILNDDRSAFERTQKQWEATIQEYQRTIIALKAKVAKMKEERPMMKKKAAEIIKRKLAESKQRSNMMMLQGQKNIRELQEELQEVRKAKHKVSEELEMVRTRAEERIIDLETQIEARTSRVSTLESDYEDLTATIQVQRAQLMEAERLYKVLQRTELDRNVFERKLKEEHMHVINLQNDKVQLLETAQREIDRLRGEIRLLTGQGRLDMFGSVVPLTPEEKLKLEENERLAKEEYERAIAPLTEKMIVSVKDAGALMLANMSAVLHQIQNGGGEVDEENANAGMYDAEGDESVADDQKEGAGEADRDELQELRDLLEQHQEFAMMSEQGLLAVPRENAYPRIRNRRELREYQEQNRQSPRAVMAMWQQVQPEYEPQLNESEVMGPSDFDVEEDRRRKRRRRDREHRNERDDDRREERRRRPRDERDRRRRRDDYYDDRYREENRERSRRQRPRRRRRDYD